MNFKGHLFFSIAMSPIFPIAAHKLNLDLDLTDHTALIAGFILGDLFPDIDTESVPSRIYASLGTLISIYWLIEGRLIEIIVLFAPFIAAKISKHRGWTHKYLLPSILVLGLISLKIGLYFFQSNFPQMESIFSFRFLIGGFSAGLFYHNIIDGRMPWYKRYWI